MHTLLRTGTAQTCVQYRLVKNIPGPAENNRNDCLQRTSSSNIHTHQSKHHHKRLSNALLCDSKTAMRVIGSFQLHNNHMGPLSYTLSIIHQNVIMRCMTVLSDNQCKPRITFKQGLFVNLSLVPDGRRWCSLIYYPDSYQTNLKVLFFKPVPSALRC